jgi:hypothetical protein
MTNDQTAPVYIFNTHQEAEEAVLALQRTGFDLKKLSIIGNGYHTEEHPVGFYSLGDRMMSWGGVGAFWGGILGLLLAPAVFMLPGLGVVALVSALEGAVVVGGASALGGGLGATGRAAKACVDVRNCAEGGQVPAACAR